MNLFKGIRIHRGLRPNGFSGLRCKELLYLTVFLLGLISCESFIGSRFDDPRDTISNEEVFDHFWQEFSDYYPYFQHKNVNWNQYYEIYRPLVDSVSTQEELFDLLEQMVYRLKDGHIVLESPFNRYQYYDWYQTDYNGNVIFANYLNYQLQEGKSGVYSYGRIQDILYVHLGSFRGSEKPFNELAQIIASSTKDTKGLILDVRTNGGGSDVNAHIIAQELITSLTRIRWIRYRNGPEHLSYSRWISNELTPKQRSYEQPIVIITDRSVFSAAEDFVLALRHLPNVYVVGQFTGGGSGNPMTRELPNGWILKVPRWQVADPLTKILYEGIGLEPDSVLVQRTLDTTLGIDRVLDFSIEYINEIAN